METYPSLPDTNSFWSPRANTEKITAKEGDEKIVTSVRPTMKTTGLSIASNAPLKRQINASMVTKVLEPTTTYVQAAAPFLTDAVEYSSKGRKMLEE